MWCNVKNLPQGNRTIEILFCCTIGDLHMTSSKVSLCKLLSIAPNFDIGCKTIEHVSVPNLKLFGPMKTKLWAKEVGELSIM